MLNSTMAIKLTELGATVQLVDIIDDPHNDLVDVKVTTKDNTDHYGTLQTLSNLQNEIEKDGFSYGDFRIVLKKLDETSIKTAISQIIKNDSLKVAFTTD